MRKNYAGSVVSRMMSRAEYEKFVVAYDKAKLVFGGKKIDMERAKRMFNLIKKGGESFASVAKQFGVTPMTVKTNVAAVVMEMANEK